MTAARASIFAALALLTLATLAFEPARSAALGTSLGQDLAGETCSTASPVETLRVLQIACGKQQTAGKLWIEPIQDLPAADAARAGELSARAEALVDPEKELACAPLWSSHDDMLLGCTVTATSWPRIVVISVSGDVLAAAAGLPSMLPVLETAIGNVSRHVPEVPGDLIKEHYGVGVLNSGADDVEGFKHLLEAGRLASGADNFAAAEEDYRSGLAIELRFFGANSMPVGETLAELALQVSNQARFDEANALFRHAQNILEGSPDPSVRLRLTSYLALNAANQRRFDEALKYARASTAELRREINDATAQASGGGPPVPAALRAELAHSLHIEAEMSLRLGDTASARAAADEVVWLVSATPALPLWWRPDALALTAEVSEQEGQVRPAEQNLRQAIELDRKLFGEGTPTALTELKLAEFYSSEQVYDAAIATFRSALAILVKDPVADANLQPDQIAPLAVAAMAQPGPEVDADLFRAIQLVQSGVADRTIARVAARRAAANPALAALVSESDAAASRRDGIRMALAAEYAKSSDQQDAKRLEALTQDLKAATAAASAIAEKVEHQFPDYAHLASPGPVPLKDLVAALEPDEAFVTFIASTKSSFVLSVTKRGLKLRKVNLTRDEIVEIVTDLRRAFVPRLNKLPDFDLASAYTLYQQLLKPVEGELTSVHHLIVAPSGEIENLPLDLLITSPPRDPHAFGDAAWLVRRFAISEVPSARAFLLLRSARQNEHKPPKPFLGIGDPEFAGVSADFNATCGAEAGAAGSLIEELPALPDSKREVEAVAASLGAGPGTVLTERHASKAELEAQPLDQFSVLYFATHGLLPGELHCDGEPGLVLSPNPGGADALLYASEISSLRMNADLVVLSACNTAASGGTSFGGGALEGLADSFFDAGARAVLASHWSVSSLATTRLMTQVFASSVRQRGYAEALRQAQLDMIADPATAKPYFWAAFTLIGDGAADEAVLATGRGT